VVRAENAIPKFVASVLQDFCGRAIEETAAAYTQSIGDPFAAELIDLGCQQFVSAHGTRLSVHQGAEYTGDLPNRIADGLVRPHLLRVEERRGERWYELAHDTLTEPVRARADRIGIDSLRDICRKAMVHIAGSERADEEGIDEEALAVGCCLHFVDAHGSRLRLALDSLQRGAARIPLWVVEALYGAGIVRRMADGREPGFELSDPRLALAFYQIRLEIDRHLRTLTELAACSEKCLRANGGSFDHWLENYDSVLKGVDDSSGVSSLLPGEAEFILRASLASGYRLEWSVPEISRKYPQLTAAVIEDAAGAAEVETRRNAAAALKLISMPGRESLLFGLAMSDPSISVCEAASVSLAAVDEAATFSRLTGCLNAPETRKRTYAVCAWMREATLAWEKMSTAPVSLLDAWWRRLPLSRRAAITAKLWTLRFQAAGSRILLACIIALISTITVTMTTRAVIAGFKLTLTQAPDVGMVVGWFHGVVGALIWGIFIGAGLLSWWFVVEGCRPWRARRPRLRSAAAGALAGLLGGVVNTFVLLHVQRPDSLFRAGWLPDKSSPLIATFTVTGLGYVMPVFGITVGCCSGLMAMHSLLSAKWTEYAARHRVPVSFSQTARIFGAILVQVLANSWCVFVPMLAAALAYDRFVLRAFGSAPSLSRILGDSVSIACGSVGLTAGLLFALYILGVVAQL
jgi:hypothetical protein